MVKNILIVLFALLSVNAFSQSLKKKIADARTNNYYEICEIANAHFDEVGRENAQGERDSEYVKFRRWEWYWSTRVLPDGSFPNMIDQKRVYDALQRSSNRDNDVTWININQTTAAGGYHGMGRLTSVAFHPTDADVFYVGAPIGGVWKTIDGGQNWIALGDSLPYLSVGNIVIDSQNPDNLFITIGDHNGWWEYGLGVYKSTDAGLTWEPTSHTTPFTSQTAYSRMIINPENPLELFVAQTDGLFRTQDGGDTWTLVHEGYHNDVLFQPGNPSTVYSCTNDYWGSSEVYVSYDSGDNWYQLTDFGTSYSQIKLTVTPANADYLGIMHNYAGDIQFYLSTDGGVNLETPSWMPEDGIIFFSPVDQNNMYCGWMNVFRSYDAGWQWEQNTLWYGSDEFHEVHADQRNVAYHPLTNEIFFCNDGGLYKYNETTDTWTDLSDGLIITQYYRIAVAQTDDTFMIGGTQDNGGRKRLGFNTWGPTNGGDAMEVAINPSDENTIYTTYINGQLYRSYDQWENDQYYEITPPQTTGGAWVTPYVIDPNDHSVLVAGYEDVFRSQDEGNTWEQLTFGITGSTDNKLDAIAVAPSNSAIIMAGRNAKLYKTIDGGENWTNHNVFPAAMYDARITSIIIHPEDPNKIFVTIGGYQSINKVRYSTNGGQTFSNITYNLPNVPVNCGIIDKDSENFDFYIGTDAGIFLLDPNANTWNYYGFGVPNTSVTDLEIQYNTRKLRAGTFGRGIWEADLASEAAVSVNNRTAENAQWVELGLNPIHDQLVLNIHATANEQVLIRISDTQGKVVHDAKDTFVMGNYQRFIPLPNLNSGIYYVQIISPTYPAQAMKMMVR
jgi:photosystem II stability/assembly factor-like uncharacterized protein